MAYIKYEIQAKQLNSVYHGFEQTLGDSGGLQPPRLLRPWDFPGKSTGVGCHRHPLLTSVKALVVVLIVSFDVCSPPRPDYQDEFVVDQLLSCI